MIKTDGGTKELFDHKDALLSGQYLDLNLYGIIGEVLRVTKSKLEDAGGGIFQLHH